jgi:hypothetical protein
VGKVPHLIVNLLTDKKVNFLNEEIYISKNDWKYSLDIKINIVIASISNINLKKELLFILKCYILDQTSMIKSIYLISCEKDNNIEIYYKINVKKIKKINIYDFEYWIEDILEEEKHYFTDSDYIGFRLVFNKDSISWKEKRIYPNLNNDLINKII